MLTYLLSFHTQARDGTSACFRIAMNRMDFSGTPGQRDSRKVHPVKVRVWNEEISKAVNDYKNAWWQWRQAGEPVCADHPLSKHMKRCKRNLRKVQQKAEARRKTEQSEIIVASAGTDKEFYRLVRQQRKTQGSTLPFLNVENKVLDTPEDICEGWAAYFQT